MSDPTDPARPDSLRAVLPVALFTAAYLLVATAVAVRGGDWEFVLYVAVVVLFAGVVAVVHRRVGLSPWLLWALSLWGLAHMLGGLLPVPEGWPIHGERRVLYSLWLVPDLLKYDHAVHAYGFATTTFVCWAGLRAAIADRGASVPPTAGLLVLAWAAGMGFGALNEVVEFAATLLVPETNVGGYVNTGWDMVANMVGATLAVAAIRLTGGGTASPSRPAP